MQDHDDNICYQMPSAPLSAGAAPPPPLTPSGVIATSTGVRNLADNKGPSRYASVPSPAKVPQICREIK